MTDDQLEATPLYRKALGCLWGGIIGDAMGTPTENLTYQEVEARFGWVSDFDSDGTDDTVMKNLCQITCNSRETVPLTLALFLLADGDVERCVTYGANLGRDADTIASMAGAVSGALRGAEGIREDWSEKVGRWSAVDQRELARRLVRAAMAKHETEGEARALFASIAPPSKVSPQADHRE